MLAWCFQTSVTGWLEFGWFSFGLAASSAESKTRGPGWCQEPNPDHGVAAGSGGGASEVVSRTFCSFCEGGTGDGLNFVQIVRSDTNLEVGFFLGVPASNLLSEWQTWGWVSPGSKWSGYVLGLWRLSTCWVVFMAVVNRHTRPRLLWPNRMAIGVALAFWKPQLFLRWWGMCADEKLI